MTGRRIGLAALPLLGLYLLTLLGLLLVYRSGDTVAIDVGSSFARPFLQGFYPDERNETINFAYSGPGARLRIPGVGRGPALLRLAISGWRPANFERPRLILRTGDFIARLAINDLRVRQYHVLLPPGNGDLDLAFESNLYTPSERDPRQLGVAIDSIEVQQLSSIPPLSTLLLLAGLATLLWAFWMRLSFPSWAAAMLVLPVLGLLIAGLAGERLLVTVVLQRVIWLALLLHLLLWPLQWLLRRLQQRHELPLSPATWQWLWAIFGMALLFKLGLAIHPHTIIFDQAAHTLRVQWTLDGHFVQRLYLPGYTSFMGETVGLEGGYFPYSPLWYLLIAPLRLLGIPIGDAMNGLNALLDTSKGLLIFLIALATLRRERLAILAALLYQLLPMPYYLISWGNYPTQFGLWAALLATTYLVLNYQQLKLDLRSRRFWMLVAFLALAMLSYTVIGIFLFTMLVFLIVFELLRPASRPLLGIVRQSGPLARAGGAGLRIGSPAGRRMAAVLLGGMLLAELFAFAVYHVVYAPAILTQTLPALVENLLENKNAELRTDVDARESPLSNFNANNGFTRNHATDLLLLIAIGGLVWLFFEERGRQWRTLWAAWSMIWVFYSYVSAFLADMVLKHVFFIMPLICIAAALSLDELWRRAEFKRWQLGAALAILALLALAIFTTERWHFYLIVKRHY